MSGLLHPFLVSTGVVATAEFGDKTQLLAIVLASRFKKPLPIILGILLATLANHAVAAWLGEWLGSLLTPEVLRWVLGVSFLAGAAWILIPDKLDEDDSSTPLAAYGALAATFVGFFLAEIGDKTQIATIALAARFEMLGPVVAGTTLGMLIANVPAVLLGHSAANRIPVTPIRIVAACLFVILGLRELL
jgi:putative Ca2+/H+ antiporter (TMEM165/GDT1 family)